MIGRVVSTKMAKTATVLIEMTKKHPLYKKTYTSSKKYLVLNPIAVEIGDMVEIEKIKPVSKRKHWKIVKVVGRNIEELAKEQLKEAAAKEVAEVMGPEKEEKDDGATSDNSKSGR
ncbi:30S ribosomal protein S17 [Candidatus Daviesbacteria bacterium]|nr:30S ribosomal protein S17 [Candidatus Daviesbacteria bacterium]